MSHLIRCIQTLLGKESYFDPNIIDIILDYSYIPYQDDEDERIYVVMKEIGCYEDRETQILGAKRNLESAALFWLQSITCVTKEGEWSFKCDHTVCKHQNIVCIHQEESKTWLEIFDLTGSRELGCYEFEDESFIYSSCRPDEPSENRAIAFINIPVVKDWLILYKSEREQYLKISEDILAKREQKEKEDIQMVDHTDVPPNMRFLGMGQVGFVRYSS